ncbi:MAG: guanylate kinase [Halobacteriovoraceae bacterium]|nr:guanylate kinase [Halobacteriovoraceae bacterium]
MRNEVERGKILVIVAPSGTGKSTLIDKLLVDFPHIKWSVSYTTRPMREGEINGKDYFFVNEKEFLRMKENDEFVEWAEVHSNYYGTHKGFINDGLKNGDILLFDVDVQGCDSFKDIYGEEAQIIFIEPPSLEHLEQRLRKRGTESNRVIQERLNNAKREIERKDDFDYKVVNDDFEGAYLNLKAVVKEILES